MRQLDYFKCWACADQKSVHAISSGPCNAQPVSRREAALPASSNAMLLTCRIPPFHQILAACVSSCPTNHCVVMPMAGEQDCHRQRGPCACGLCCDSSGQRPWGGSQTQAHWTLGHHYCRHRAYLQSPVLGPCHHYRRGTQKVVQTSWRDAVRLDWLAPCSC